MRQNKHPHLGRVGFTLNFLIDIFKEAVMRITTLLALTLSLLAGCSSQPIEQSSAIVEDRSPGAVSTPEVTLVSTTGPTGVLDPILTDPKSPLSKRSIYFDLDSYIVKDEYQVLLGHHARYLTSNAKYKMLMTCRGIFGPTET